MDKEYLQKIVNESLNRKEVLEKLNMTACENRYFFKKKIII